LNWKQLAVHVGFPFRRPHKRYGKSPYVVPQRRLPGPEVRFQFRTRRLRLKEQQAGVASAEAVTSLWSALIASEQEAAVASPFPILQAACPSDAPPSLRLILDAHIRDLRGPVRGPFQIVRHLLCGQVLLLSRGGHLLREP